MGRELQKKKARSGRQPIRQLNRSKKILNPRGNDAIAKNWYGQSPSHGRKRKANSLKEQEGDSFSKLSSPRSRSTSQGSYRWNREEAWRNHNPRIPQ